MRDLASNQSHEGNSLGYDLGLQFLIDHNAITDASPGKKGFGGRFRGYDIGEYRFECIGSHWEFSLVTVAGEG
jgi:hypothetical protein